MTAKLVLTGGKVTVQNTPEGVRPFFWCEDLEEEKSWDSKDGDKVRTTVRGVPDDSFSCELLQAVDEEDNILFNHDDKGQVRCTFGPYTHRRAHPTDPPPLRFAVKNGVISVL
jgi:hypothetical protein